MGYEKYLNIDFTAIAKQIWHYIWLTLEIILKTWLSIPKWIRVSLFVIICVIAAVLLYLCWKYKDDWRHVYTD